MQSVSESLSRKSHPSMMLNKALVVVIILYHQQSSLCMYSGLIEIILFYTVIVKPSCSGISLVDDFGVLYVLFHWIESESTQSTFRDPFFPFTRTFKAVKLLPMQALKWPLLKKKRGIQEWMRGFACAVALRQSKYYFRAPIIYRGEHFCCD